MHITRLDPEDAELIRSSYQVYLAAHELDNPEAGLLGPAFFGHWLTVGWSPAPRQTWLAISGDGTVAGWYLVRLPDQENRDKAHLDLLVHPASRRRGVGRELLRHATSRAIAAGRTTLSSTAVDGRPGEFFARAAGASPGFSDVLQVQDLTALPPLAEVRAGCERAAAGYSTVSWTGPVPEEYLDGVAAVYAAMGDTPRDPDSQRARWTAQRIREEVNVGRAGDVERSYAVAARCDATAEIAALTDVFVQPDVPDWAAQGTTAVVRKHRGHRLGLLVKLAMLDLLAAAEPGLDRIQTWNATVNSHMIAVNEALGYQVAGPPHTRWRLALGQS
jgi:GNAT superfamily N-acetyltransferase/RimJ/RimL family protein N-acetyltransferase